MTADTEALGTELAKRAAPKERKTLTDLIERQKPALAELLRPVGMDADRFGRTLLLEVRRNPLLGQCDPLSVLGAGTLCAQLALWPGPLGHAYFIPFRDGKTNTHVCTFVIGYTGIAELGRRGGAVGLRANVVWDVDEFVAPWENEKGQHWLLRPGEPTERKERLGCLVTWKERTERLALFMPPERVDIALKASRNPKAREFAKEDWYWRKTAIRFARPWLPLSADLATAAAYDEGVVLYDEGLEALEPPEGEDASG